MPTLSRRLRKILKWTAGIYLFIVLSGLVLDGFFQFRASDTETMAWFVHQGLPIHIRYYEAQGRQIRYVYTDNAAGKPVILFIHGAPSSSDYYRYYMADPSLREAASMIAVDRPGYGYSGLGDPEPDLGKQAAMIRPILDSLRRSQRPVIIAGASYGTSIACRLAMDYPQLVDGLVLLAPSLAPGEEKTYAISYVLESPLFRWAQPRMIHSANVEKFAHETELRKMLGRWDQIRVPVIYMQGQEDELIYTSNADFARRQLTNSARLEVKMLPGMGHLIAFKAHGLIRGALGNMLQLSEAFYASRSDVSPGLQAQATITKPEAIPRVP